MDGSRYRLGPARNRSQVLPGVTTPHSLSSHAQALQGTAGTSRAGPLLWLGVVGAACFLVAISWLGVGAAFPANLVMAAGVLLLLRGRPRCGR